MGAANHQARSRTAGISVGVDLTSVAQVRDALATFGDRYARRVYTDHELASSLRATGLSPESLAARFAAKEATLKVLEPTGTKPQWRDIEVQRAPHGACRIALHRRAAALAAARGLGPMSVSLSHEADLAVAVVAAMRAHTPTAPGARPGEGDAQTDTETTHRRRTGMTTAEDCTTRIKAVLDAHAKLPVDVATLEDDDDLFQAGMTSHASVNVMLALEDDFDLEFPEAALNKRTFSSVGALRRALLDLMVTEVPA